MTLPRRGFAFHRHLAAVGLGFLLHISHPPARLLRTPGRPERLNKNLFFQGQGRKGLYAVSTVDSAGAWFLYEPNTCQAPPAQETSVPRHVAQSGNRSWTVPTLTSHWILKAFLPHFLCPHGASGSQMPHLFTSGPEFSSHHLESCRHGVLEVSQTILQLRRD